MKKPFNQTDVGKFLKSKGFNIVMNAVGTVVPGVKLLNDVKEMVIGDPVYKSLSEEDQQTFLNLHNIEMELLDKQLADVADARDLYEKKNEMADAVARRIIKYNLPIIFLLVCVLIACTIYLKDNVLLALISSSIGGVCSQLSTERMTIVNFFFGSSAGSKEKQQIILTQNEKQ